MATATSASRLALALVAFTGCATNGGEAHDAAVDRPTIDLSPADLAPELRRDLADAAAPDASAALAGVGELRGQCGVLDDAVWADAAPALFRNALDFGASYVFSADELSPGGKEVFDDGNLGGSSLHSEVFAFEVLRRCELAELLKTEGEVLYEDPGGKKIDLLLTIDGRKVGVSVTRAVGYPRDAPFTVEAARALLDKKLADLPAASGNAAPADRWQRSLLTVLAYGPAHADALEQAFAELPPATRADALLLITVTDGDDAFLY